MAAKTFNAQLVNLAEKIKMAPTMINWLEDNPENALRELWAFYSLKGEIIELLEELVYAEEGNNKYLQLLEKLQKFNKETLF